MRVYALYTSDKNCSRRQEYYLLPQDIGYLYTLTTRRPHTFSESILLLVTWVYVRVTDIPAICNPHLRRNPKVILELVLAQHKCRRRGSRWTWPLRRAKRFLEFICCNQTRKWGGKSCGSSEREEELCGESEELIVPVILLYSWQNIFFFMTA